MAKAKKTKSSAFPPPHYVGTRRWWLKDSGGIAVKDRLVAPRLTGDDFIKGGLSGKADNDHHNDENVEAQCTDCKHCMLGWINAVLDNTRLERDKYGDGRYRLIAECVSTTLKTKLQTKLFAAMKRSAPEKVVDEIGSYTMDYISERKDIPVLNDAKNAPRPWLAKVWNDTLKALGFKLIPKPKGYKCGVLCSTYRNDYE